MSFDSLLMEAELVDQLLNDFRAADVEAVAMPGDYIGPTLRPMQRWYSAQVRERPYYGNFSSTGAGKTLAAVAAVLCSDARMTVIVCPLQVVGRWQSEISGAVRDPIILTGTLSPVWPISGADRRRFLIIHHDMLSNSNAETCLSAIAEGGVDCIIFDEGHRLKRRERGQVSHRHNAAFRFTSACIAANSSVKRLLMTATPVVNELTEAVAALELMEGVERSDLRDQCKPNVGNAMLMHRQLATHGIRFHEPQAFDGSIERVDVSAEDWAAGWAATGTLHAGVLRAEQVAAALKRTTLIRLCRDAVAAGDRVFVYAHYEDGIRGAAAAALHDAGLRVTDNHKDFIDVPDRWDVLLTGQAAGVGIDGMQKNCATLIFLSLPWTHAEVEQVRGRLIRPGQTKPVRVHTLVVTHPTDNPDLAPWDEYRLARVESKRTLADAVMDGVIPDEFARTPEQAAKDLLAWVERLRDGQELTVTVPIAAGVVAAPREDERVAARVRFGDFSRMNSRWNGAGSKATHVRLRTDPQEWHDYHELYRAARESWDVVPVERAAQWVLVRPAGLRVADLGCGEAILADRVGDHAVIRSFDHVAVDDRVTVTDVANLRGHVDDGAMDAVVLSLALMGTNWADYLAETARILRMDGALWLAETTTRVDTVLTDIQGVLRRAGFGGIDIHTEGSFTIIEASKRHNINMNTE